VNGYVYLSDGSDYESWGLGGHDADDYDIPMIEYGTASGHYVCQFDAAGNIGEGIYRIAIYLQTGANPVDADVCIAQGELYWDGRSEINLYTLDKVKFRFGPWR